MRGISTLDGVIEKYEENLKLAVERKKLADIEMNVGAEALKREYPFLRDYQAIAAVYILTKKKFLLGDEMGLGKTVISMPLVDKIVKSGGRVIILCPSSMGKQWKEEILRFVGYNACIIIKKTASERMKVYDSSEQIIISTYEAFKIDFPNVGEIDGIICDEASKAKNRTSGVYKTLVKASRNTEYLLLLTGTPVENSLSDIFHLISIISPTFMTRKTFTERYLIVENSRFGEKIVGYRNLANFLYIVSNFFIRRRRCDIVSEMPPLTVINRIIELTPAQKLYAAAIRRYAKENDAMGSLILLNEIGDDVSMIDNSSSAIATTLRKQGKLPMRSPDKSNKIPELINILGELSSPTLIFTQYKVAAKLVQQALTKEGYRCLCLTGDNSVREREQGIQDMRAGKYNVCVATEIFSYGVNLNFIHNLVNFEVNYNPGKYLQRVGRIYGRGDDVTPKTVINLISEDIDERIWDIVNEKNDLFKKVVDGEVISDETMRKRILQKLL